MHRTSAGAEPQVDLREIARRKTAACRWPTRGHGVDTQPDWNLGNPPLADIGGTPPPGNAWAVPGIGNLDGCEFIQLRISLFLSQDMSPSDAGPYIDHWTIHFEHDQ